MKNIILLVCVFSFMISCQNEINLKGTIQGVVQTNKKAAIEGAKVSIYYLDEAGVHDLSKTVLTDANGNYSFPEIGYCTFRLEVSKTGYNNQTKAYAISEKSLYNRVELTVAN